MKRNAALRRARVRPSAIVAPEERLQSKPPPAQGALPRPRHSTAAALWRTRTGRARCARGRLRLWCRRRGAPRAGVGVAEWDEVRSWARQTFQLDRDETHEFALTIARPVEGTPREQAGDGAALRGVGAADDRAAIRVRRDRGPGSEGAARRVAAPAAGGHRDARPVPGHRGTASASSRCPSRRSSTCCRASRSSPTSSRSAGAAIGSDFERNRGVTDTTPAPARGRAGEAMQPHDLLGSVRGTVPSGSVVATGSARCSDRGLGLRLRGDRREDRRARRAEARRAPGHGRAPAVFGRGPRHGPPGPPPDGAGADLGRQGSWYCACWS